MTPNEQDDAKTPTSPIPSATVMMLRDGQAGLEVLLLERHGESSFGGASVFPGGKVDPADSEPEILARCDGLEGRSAAQSSFYVAAIREAFEETGVLLARPPGDSTLISGAHSSELSQRYGGDLLGGSISIAEIVQREDLRLACNRLVPFARWITPEIAPKRFDTFFFLAAAPPDCRPVADGAESVLASWVRPEVAIQESESGARRVVFPTRATLSKLALTNSAQQALDRTSSEGMVTVMPETRPDPDGAIIFLPPEAGFPISEIRMAAIFDPRNYPNREKTDVDPERGGDDHDE